MDFARLIAIALAIAVVVALLRLIGGQRVAPTPRRRWVALLLAQPLLALLLYFALFPPRIANHAASNTLLVLTADTPAADIARARAGNAVALPEAGVANDPIERTPDLATALRRHPQTRALRVLGSGLEARDLAAAATLPVQFDAPIPLPGLIELHVPQRLAPGQGFDIEGVATSTTRIELRDPADKPVASTRPDANGHFHLAATVRSAGVAEFHLHLLDAHDGSIESATIPLQVVDAAAPLRVAMLSAAANAESKFLRRWAQGAGMDVIARVQLGGGIAVGDAFALDAATLRTRDLLVLDARSLESIDVAALRVAVEQGLGLLVRLDDAPSPTALAQLRALGLSTNADAGTATLVLRAIDTQPQARWRSLGRGRIGLWPVTDSYALALRGDAAYANLWSTAFATLARSGTQRDARIEGERVAQRIAICPVEDGAQVEGDGAATPLLPDPAAGNCAAYWPTRAGWHWLREGARLQPFFVRADDDAPGLQRAQRSAATAALAGDKAIAGARDGATSPGLHGPAWPWWLAFLLCAAATWWLERRRR